MARTPGLREVVAATSAAVRSGPVAQRRAAQPSTAAVVGLDVSMDRIGWGAVRLDDGAPLGCGMVSIRPPDYNKGVEPGPWDYTRPRYLRAGMRDVRRTLDDVGAEPAAVFLEAPWVGPNHARVIGLALAVGSAWQIASRWADCALVAPSDWRYAHGIPNNPRGMRAGSRKLLEAACTWAAERGMDPAVIEQLKFDRPEKPFVYAVALDYGFNPRGCQDAADAGLIAAFGYRFNAETWARAQELDSRRALL